MGNSLEQKIDGNKNSILEEKELVSFISNEKNLKELGSHLSQRFLSFSDTLLRVTQELLTKQTLQIAQKVKANKPLSSQEQSVVKLDYIIRNKSYPTIDMSFYVGSMYGNTMYGKQIPSLEPKSILLQSKKEITPSDLPILNYEKGYETASVKRLDKWFQSYDYTAYMKARMDAMMRVSQKPEAYRDDYLKYEMANIALEHYAKIITTQDKKFQTQAGYKNTEDYNRQMKIISELSTALSQYEKEKFPTISTTIKKFESYTNDINITAKKYGYTSPEKQNKSAESYKQYSGEVAVLSQKFKIEELKKTLANPSLKSGADLENYFKNANLMSEYAQQCNQLKQKHDPKALQQYEKYMKSVGDITTKYGPKNISDWGNQIERYMQGINSFKKGYAGHDVDFKVYEKYQSLVAKNGFARQKAGVSNLSLLLSDPTQPNSPFHGLTIEAEEKKRHQSVIDQRRRSIKDFSPTIYQTLNFASGAWNGLVDFTVGTGSSLGLMIMKLYKDDNEWKASTDFKGKFDNFLKFGQSTAQNKPPIDEQGNRNLGADNTVNQVGSQLANMLSLLSGAGAIGRGVTKLGVGAMISQKVGLVSMAFITQVGRSFEEAKLQGLDDSQALSYTLLQSSIGSGLELISPNDMIMGSGKKVVKEYIKNILKTETKQSLLQVSKLFVKNLGGEIVEENMQEAMQLAVGNGINMRANDKRNAKFDATMTLDNFATTALLTTLTTGVASAKGSAKSTISSHTSDAQLKLKQEIASHPLLYGQVTEMLQKMISNKSLSQGMSIDALKQLDGELRALKGGKKVASDGVEGEKTRLLAEKNNPDMVLYYGELKDNLIGKIAQQKLSSNEKNELLGKEEILKDKTLYDLAVKKYGTKTEFEKMLKDTIYQKCDLGTLFDEKILQSLKTMPQEWNQQIQIMGSYGLSFHEAYAILLYTHFAYLSINNYARGSLDQGILMGDRLYTQIPMSGEVLLKSKILFDLTKNGIKKLPIVKLSDINKLQSASKINKTFEKGVLCRDIGFRTEQELKLFLQKITPNSIYEEEGFFSTSIFDNSDSGYGPGKFRVRFLVDQSENGRYISPFSDSGDEGEIIFGPGTKFFVKSMSIGKKGECIVSLKGIVDSAIKSVDNRSIQSFLTTYPDLLKNIVNPETIQQIINSEINAGNLLLNADGSIKEVYTEVGGEKKPSQLFAKMKADGFSEQQALKTWLQVRTPEFKNRFGDWQNTDKSQVSKVVDENGEPLVVYHGTPNRFSDNQFLTFEEADKKGLQGSSNLQGIAFTTDYFAAKDYAEKFHKSQLEISNPHVYPIFLKINTYYNYERANMYSTHKKTLMMNDQVKIYEKKGRIEGFDTENIHFSDLFYDTMTKILEKENYVIDSNRIYEIGKYRIHGSLIDVNDILGTQTQFYTDDKEIRNDFRQIVKTNKDGIYVQPSFDGTGGSEKIFDQYIVFDPKNIKSAIDNDGSFSPETAKFNDYFGKESRFGFDSKQARDHSAFMDQFTGQATVEHIAQIRQQIESVAQMYTDKTGKKFELSDVQIQAIIDTHLLPGQLGSLTQAELIAKNRKLAEAIPDADVRRFLLEAGFCGLTETSNIDNITKDFPIDTVHNIEMTTDMLNNQIQAIEIDIADIKNDIDRQSNGANTLQKARGIISRFILIFPHILSTYKTRANETRSGKKNDYKKLLNDIGGNKNNMPSYILKLMSITKDVSNLVSFVGLHGKVGLEMFTDINTVHDTIKYLKLDVYFKKMKEYVQKNKEVYDRQFYSYKFKKRFGDSNLGLSKLQHLSFDTAIHSVQSLFIMMSEISFFAKSILYLNNSLQINAHTRLQEIEKTNISNSISNNIDNSLLTFSPETLSRDIQHIYDGLQNYLTINRKKFDGHVLVIIENMMKKSHNNKESFFETLDETIDMLGGSVRWVDDPYNKQKQLDINSLFN